MKVIEMIREDVTVPIDFLIEHDKDRFLELLDQGCRSGPNSGPLTEISWEIIELGEDPNTIVLAITGIRVGPVVPPDGARQELLADFKAWELGRISLSAAEEDGTPPKAGDWQGSDEAGLELLGRAIEIIQGEQQ